MNIRRAIADDALMLAKVHVDSWQAAYKGIVPDTHLERFTYAWRERVFRHSITKNLEETYLITDGDTPVAILTIGANRDDDLDKDTVGELWGIYIHPDYWRRGIGTWLVQEAEKMLTDRGYQTVVLWVLDDNQEARKFYEKVGFAFDGTSKTVNLTEPMKAVRYQKVMAEE